MHFKSLEIVGFKSFLTKTKLKFEKGVTAVVGPNGCGKSNIVDAIKWVLGEQSTKSMRSSTMLDVIFNGTEKQDPVNVAEVALTLSNEDRTLPVDYDEVIISRKLYRSGESEYLINKTPVRLTDVRNLLMGTGIGTSSYSIVEQGRMDMILSSKPEERRYIFEEASGITRYKAKKREAMLKLDRTKDNLTRINDIVREVERQIKSIERKARKAERYKAKFDELKELDLKLAYKKFSELSTDDTSLGSENGKMRERAATLTQELEGAADMLFRLKEELNGTVAQLQASQNEVMQLTSDIDKSKYVIRVNNERMQELEKTVQRFDWEIGEATESKEGLMVRLESLETRVADIGQKRQDKEDAMKAVEDAVNSLNKAIEEHKRALKTSKEKTMDIVAEQTRARNSSIKIEADIQNALSRDKRLKMEKENVGNEKERISERMVSIEERSEGIREDLARKKSEFVSFNEEFTTSQNKLSVLLGERGQKEKRVNEIAPRREFLEKLLDEREGINDSVKNIIQLAEGGDQGFSGVHGILAELISVKEGYEESIGTVLGDASQSIVVSNRNVAEKIAEYLKENSMDSINFIILSELERFILGGWSMPWARKPKTEVLNDVTQVLVAKEPYRSALKELMSDVFVAASSEEAKRQVAGDRGFKGRMIGRRGEILRRGFLRTQNYSSKEVIPLFGRKEKVEELKRDESRMRNEIEEVTARITDLETWLLESAREKQRLEAELQQKQVEFSDITSKKESIREKLDSLTEEVQLLDSEIEEETQIIKGLVEDKEVLDARIEEFEEEHARVKQAGELAQEGVQEAAKRREETMYAMSDIKAELFSLRKEEENISENFERERSFCERVDKEVLEKRERINECGQKMDELRAEIKSLEEKNAEHNLQVEMKGGNINEKQEGKDSLEQKIRHEEQVQAAKERELEGIKNKTRDLDILKKEIEYKRAAIVEKAQSAYKVDISTMEAPQVSEDMNWDEVEAQIKDIKEQIEKMGDVSLDAMDEHKQLEERFQFLTKQREDLTNGREALMQAIQKINRTTRKKFMETFEGIKKEFNDYFRMLFNGGKAELVLEDESNVLECGIDIIVRPPGKKLHNIMQLSGGEKAMTAIALIFAIFKVNPSPFCILDEIDAPLDESNIVRFCRVLQEFLKLSQFVIVTHNRMTIQLADVLYGITMQEKGVSKIVSVKITDEEELKEETKVGVPA